MTRIQKAQTAIQNLLPEDETILGIERCAIKSEKKAKRIGKSVATSAAASVALAAVGAGFGVGVVSVPKPMWVVVTSKRVAIFVDPGQPRNCVGELVFNAARDAVALTERMVCGLLREVAIVNAATQDVLVRLNFGIRKNAFDRLMQAA